VRTNVSFRHPAPFVSVVEVKDVLAREAAGWFVDLLERIQRLEVNRNLAQEDWGVAVLVRRDGKRFWIGLSRWEVEGEWLAHVHHGSFAWIQARTSGGAEALRALVRDLHRSLAGDTQVSGITWYEESDMSAGAPGGAAEP
jgi:hypothetical protein